MHALRGLPEWEYDRHPRRLELARGGFRRSCGNSERGDPPRPFSLIPASHARLFDGLTPDRLRDTTPGTIEARTFRAFARTYVESVGILRSRRPCASSELHEPLAIRLVPSIAALDYATTGEDLRFGESADGGSVSQCRVFELFLRIHPYANGNDHVARFVVWGVLRSLGSTGRALGHSLDREHPRRRIGPRGRPIRVRMNAENSSKTRHAN